MDLGVWSCGVDSSEITGEAGGDIVVEERMEIVERCTGFDETGLVLGVLLLLVGRDLVGNRDIHTVYREVFGDLVQISNLGVYELIDNTGL